MVFFPGYCHLIATLLPILLITFSTGNSILSKIYNSNWPESPGIRLRRQNIAFIPCSKRTGGARQRLYLLNTRHGERSEGWWLSPLLDVSLVSHPLTFSLSIASLGKPSFSTLERGRFFQFYLRLEQGLGA